MSLDDFVDVLFNPISVRCHFAGITSHLEPLIVDHILYYGYVRKPLLGHWLDDITHLLTGAEYEDNSMTLKLLNFLHSYKLWGNS